MIYNNKCYYYIIINADRITLFSVVFLNSLTDDIAAISAETDGKYRSTLSIQMFG